MLAERSERQAMSDDTRSQAPPVPRLSSRWSAVLRAVAFAVWVAALNVWLSRHLRSGVGLEQLAALVGVPAAAFVAGSAFDYMLDEDDKKTLRDAIHRFFRVQLSVPTLILLYIALGLLGTFRSTLTVIPDEGEISKLDVAWSLEPATPLFAAQRVAKPLDIGLWINPFAPDYRVAVAKYLPTIVRVPPFTGATLVPSRDLVRAPTILLRPRFEAAAFLRQGGQLIAYEIQADGAVELGRATGARARFLGPARAQPGTLMLDWQLESTGFDLDARASAQLLRRWRVPAPFEPAQSLAPGSRLCALVTNVDGKVVAGVVASIGADEYQDIPIDQVEVVNGDTQTRSHADVCACIGGSRC